MDIDAQNDHQKPKESKDDFIGKRPATGRFPDWALDARPSPEPVDGRLLLDDLAALFTTYVVLPKFAAEALALFTVHTHAFQLRDVTAYLGVESPLKRCGKSTLLAVLSTLVNRPVISSNISPSAFFRVIEETRPTLLIDEADTLLKGNDELRGILNSGYTRSTAFVVRVANQPPQTADVYASRAAPPENSASWVRPATLPPTSSLAVFSSWCPKVMAAIGHLPDTLSDRCIVIRMQRKTARELCERLRNLKPAAQELKSRCARFVLDHANTIAGARPAIPAELNDRAADVWEPLLAIADIAGGHWPEQARLAAVALAESSTDSSPIGSLFLDILVLFTKDKIERVFTRALVDWLNRFPNRAWAELNSGKPIDELWLSRQLRPYGIRPKTIRIGDCVARGYVRADFTDCFKRYISRVEFKALLTEVQPPDEQKESETAAENGQPAV